MTPWAYVIISQVCAKHRVTGDELTGHRRTGPLVEARHEAWERLYEYGLTQAQIAGLFHRDHQTVCAALKKRLVRVGE